MRHDPATKASALQELSAGYSYEDVVRKYGVPLTTLRRWQEAVPVDVTVSQESPPRKETQTLPRLSREEQRQEFSDAFVRLAHKTLLMLEGWAEECADPAFIRQRTGDVIEMGRAVCAYLDRLAPIVLGPVEPGADETLDD